MDPKTLAAIADGARTLVGETEGLADALQYTEQLASDTNTDLRFGYAKDSEEYAALVRECNKAIREASKRR